MACVPLALAPLCRCKIAHERIASGSQPHVSSLTRLPLERDDLVDVHCCPYSANTLVTENGVAIFVRQLSVCLFRLDTNAARSGRLSKRVYGAQLAGASSSTSSMSSTTVCAVSSHDQTVSSALSCTLSLRSSKNDNCTSMARDCTPLA